MPDVELFVLLACVALVPPRDAETPLSELLVSFGVGAGGTTGGCVLCCPGLPGVVISFGVVPSVPALDAVSATVRPEVVDPSVDALDLAEGVWAAVAGYFVVNSSSGIWRI